MYQDERNQTVAEAPVVPKLEPYQELLLAAAQYIRDHGWCQGTDKNFSGEVCMRGAVRMAHAENKKPPKDGVYSAAYSRLVINVGGCVTAWNDVPGRTKEEVIERIEYVAKNR